MKKFSIFLSGLTCALLLLSSKSAFAQSTISDLQTDDYHLTYSNLPQTQVVTFRGEIPPGAKRNKIQNFFTQLIPNKNITLLIGNSFGGDVKAYHAMINGMRQMCPKNSCQITSFVQNLCGSMCGELFMNGDRRIISSQTLFGFHREYFKVGPFEVKTQSPDELINIYISLGADPTWMKSHEQALVANQTYGVWVNPKLLLEANIAQTIDSDFSKNFPVPADFAEMKYYEAGSTFLQN